MSLTHAPSETEVPDVAVVLPCYNERDHVELGIKRIRAALEAAGMRHEVLCIDDGSTDGTREVLQGIEGIRTVLLPCNQGSGTARRIGTQQAHGRAVVWTDADMTYPNERIPELVAQLDDTYDQVVAGPADRGRHLPAGPGGGQMGHPQAGVVPDQHRHPRPELGPAGLQAVGGRAVPAAAPAGFSCVTTITLAFLSNGHQVKYVPIDYLKRAGRSKFRGFSQIFLAFTVRHAGHEPAAALGDTGPR